MRSQQSSLKQAVSILAVSTLLSAPLCFAQTAPDPGLLARARTLVDQKQAAQAFALLEPLEASAAGIPEFDYLLGIAALDSGNFQRATVALERVLAVRPDFASARLDLARTYFAMGSLDLARQEFERLLKQDPTPAGREVIERFLKEISDRQGSQDRRIGGSLQWTVGRDNNITNATSNFTEAIQGGFGIPGVDPTGNSIRREAAYTELSGGLNLLFPLRGRYSWATDVDGRSRWFRNARDFDLKLLDGRTGIRFKQDDFAIRLDGQAQWYRQKGAAPASADAKRQTSDRNTRGGRVDAQWALSGQVLLLGTFQYNRFRFNSNPSQDTNQQMASVSVLKEWSRPKLVTVASVFASRDRALRPLNPDSPNIDASRRNEGMRAFVQWSATPRADAQFSVGYSIRRDDKAFARAQTVAFGRDATLDMDAGVAWRFGSNWTLRPAVSHTRNTSNIALYRFNRTDYSLSLKRDFD